jgi:flagellum-specific peptidoglycan hydrolase FlgJ
VKILGALGISIVLLFLLAPAPAYSQERDENKPAVGQEEKGKDKAKHEDKATKQDEGKRGQEPAAGREAGRDENERRPEAARPQQEQREQREQRVDRDREQRPAHAQRGKTIPQEKFRASFGRQHTFHVQRTQIINNPQPIIFVSGYQFQLIDPWPAEWAFEDDCYIDYVDGEYFLFNAFHPGIRIAVFVIG